MVRPSSLPLHLRGQLARKLFVRFMIAATVPLIGLAWYSYDILSRVLHDALVAELRNDAKSFGMEVIGDIRKRAALLPALVADHEVPPGSGFTHVTEDSEAELAQGMPHVLEALNTLGVALSLDSSNGARIWTRNDDGNILAGVLEEELLWVRDILQPPYCLLRRTGEVIFCSEGFSATPQRGQRVNLAQTALRNSKGDELITGRWQANLEGLFGEEGFIVLVARSERELTAPLTQLRVAFIALLALAIAISVILAMAQLRRQLKPLDNLTTAAGRIANGELDARVEIEGNDELAALGTTFNRMVQALAAKFVLLRLLSELDRAIIEGVSRRRIAEKVLDDLLAACLASDGGLLFLGDRNETFFLPAPASVHANRFIRKLPTDGVGDWADLAAERPYRVAGDIVAQLAETTDRAPCNTVLFPMKVEGAIRGFLLLSVERGASDVDDLLHAGSSIAERLSVAGSSKAREEVFYQQTHFNPLTGLPNRVLLRDRVAQAVVRAEAHGGAFALMLIDFDEFRLINEALSRQAGDLFLQEQGQRLKALAGSADTVAHLGVDRFALLELDLHENGRELQLHAMVERIQRELSSPVIIDGRPVLAEARIGIALCPDNAGDFDNLIDCAEVALRHAKQQEGGTSRFFSPDMNAAVAERFELAQELRAAIRNDELLLYFQPKVDAASAHICGSEALIRWNSPKRGLVSPGVFLPVLEDMGLNRWLTDFVLDRACRQIRSWDDEGLLQIGVSVNVPPDELLTEDFEVRIAQAMDRYGIGPGRLEIEILESSETDGAQVKERLERLRKRGVKVSLDDFGTGYSSLVYLTAIPADVLKLDRAFIRHMVGDARQQSIVRQVISLAHSLGFSVVAEGVEEQGQRELLVEMGCNQIQGYLFSPPLPVEKFAQRLNAQTVREPVAARA